MKIIRFIITVCLGGLFQTISIEAGISRISCVQLPRGNCVLLLHDMSTGKLVLPSNSFREKLFGGPAYDWAAVGLLQERPLVDFFNKVVFPSRRAVGIYLALPQKAPGYDFKDSLMKTPGLQEFYRMLSSPGAGSSVRFNNLDLCSFDDRNALDLAVMQPFAITEFFIESFQKGLDPATLKDTVTFNHLYEYSFKDPHVLELLKANGAGWFDSNFRRINHSLAALSPLVHSQVFQQIRDEGQQYVSNVERCLITLVGSTDCSQLAEMVESKLKSTEISSTQLIEYEKHFKAFINFGIEIGLLVRILGDKHEYSLAHVPEHQAAKVLNWLELSRLKIKYLDTTTREDMLAPGIFAKKLEKLYTNPFPCLEFHFDGGDCCELMCGKCGRCCYGCYSFLRWLAR